SSSAGKVHEVRPSTLCSAGEACTDSRCPDLHGDPHAAASGPGTSDAAAADPATAGGTRPGPGPEGLRAARVWIRRLYTDPVTGVLTQRDPRRRFFTDSMRALVVARDRSCRNRWCGAPIRTVDHIHRHADGGPTAVDNGRGLCERCNLARERPRALVPGPDHYLPAPPLLSAPPLVSAPQPPPAPPRSTLPAPQQPPAPPRSTLPAPQQPPAPPRSTLPAPPASRALPVRRGPGSARPDAGDRGDPGGDEEDPDHPRE